MTCPVHNLELLPQTTRYGKLFRCPKYDECTVLGWDNKTSMPADHETRQARNLAHKAFDPLWKGKGNAERHTCYRALALYLNISMRDCHIGMFSKEQCEKVLEFCKVKMS